jgi:hypothetical protein
MKASLPVLVLSALAPELSSLVFAQAPLKSDGDPHGAAKIEFASTVFDFGKIMSGEVVKHDFVFTNTGSAALEILAVKPGCGCTTAGTWDKKVEPGKTGTIPLQFNSGAFNGPVTKFATVTTSDAVASNVVLQLTGTIWKAIEITPPMAVFNFSSEDQSNATKVLRILNNLPEPLTLSDLQCTNESFQAELKTVQPGKEFELSISAVPPFKSPSIAAAVTLKTSSRQMPMISVIATVVVQPTIAVSPEQVLLPSGPLAAAVASNIEVRNNGTNLLELSDARVDAPGVEVRLQQPVPGRYFTLALSFPAGFQVPVDKKLELSIKSNHPKSPLIKVPIFHLTPNAPVVPLPVVAASRNISPTTRVIPTRPAAAVTAEK